MSRLYLVFMANEIPVKRDSGVAYEMKVCSLQPYKITENDAISFSSPLVSGSFDIVSYFHQHNFFY